MGRERFSAHSGAAPFAQGKRRKAPALPHAERPVRLVSGDSFPGVAYFIAEVRAVSIP